MSTGKTLGDFTTTWRMIPIGAIAVCIGVLTGFVALGLLRLIGLFTNLFFYQHWSFSFASPSGNHLGLLEIFVPVIGGVLVGLMARFGSDRIRGHGIPEAIEAILLRGGRVEPKVAFWKPISAAVSIGSGGPFGAEGPIIMTGGAFGSLVAQFFHLTSAERKTLLVAAAAGGMSATFATPLAAVLLAVELLLFEWKPRSLIPVALASVSAAATRRYIIGLGPLFPVHAHPTFVGPQGLFGCVLVGLLAGALSALLTFAIYAAEDGFQKLPIHWMWWPALGGLVIGTGGLLYPQALGVGYDTIGTLLQGDVTRNAIIGILLVKSIIWAVSLGSGTSGGVLAPLLMMGGALGGLLTPVLPNEGLGFWPLISMGAILGGTMRSPFTGVVFALELTHDVNIILPLLLASVISHAFTVLTLRRSILTEKISRRGFHLSREYSVDPLEIIFAREVMRTNVVALPLEISMEEMANFIHHSRHDRRQHLYPVVDNDRHLIGVVTRHELEQLADHRSEKRYADVIRREPVIAHLNEPLRIVVSRMAQTGLTRLPVIEQDHKLAGMISLNDLLKARTLNFEAEHRRERIFPIRLVIPFRARDSKGEKKSA